MEVKELNSLTRAYISTSALTLLCDFAAGDLNRPLHQIDVDWKEVFEAVCRNGVLGLTSRYLKEGLDRDIPPVEFKEWVRDTYRTNAIRLALMYRRVSKTLALLTESGIDFMVIKGPVLAQSVYPDKSLRPFNDLDVIIRERDWPAMHYFLLQKGFQSAENLANPPPKLSKKMVLYELKYFEPVSNLLVEIHLDDLFNAGLASKNIDMFWQRTVQVEVEGIVVKTLALEDQLIHLCMHAHFHGYTRVNWFSDIALLMQTWADHLDWQQFIETVKAEEVEAGVYYTLYFLKQLFAVPVPSHVLMAIKPDRFRCWWHDYYMPPANVLSMQPMWRPDFSFYFQPLYKRLLPDLLVMGRRKEKIVPLLRLIVPPADWLRYYYKLGDDQSLMLHYLLHPIKIGFHYVVETFSLLRTNQKKTRLSLKTQNEYYG